MSVLLTGGSGDLGTVLSRDLTQRGQRVLRLDVRPPRDPRGEYLEASILDRAALTNALRGVDAVVHIAAWHGVHLQRGWRDVYDFWDLNVTGTFNLLEAAARAGARKLVFVSSTSADDPYGVYGQSKVLGEELVKAYHARHGLRAINLRPRAFIPHWNREVYTDFVAWSRWFWKGAVHIDDVSQGVLLALDRLEGDPLPQVPTLTLDGAYEYSLAELADWKGQASFARRYPQFLELVERHGLDSARKPRRLDISETTRALGYTPRYSLRSLLEELDRYGSSGPPPPF